MLTPSFKLVVGLGNPGIRYEDTRHNAGQWFLDHLREAWGYPRFEQVGANDVAEGTVGGAEVRLMKPRTYMNRSGIALKHLRLLGFDPAGYLLVVVDDVALPPGKARFRRRGGPGGHNGLRSVEWAVGQREYARLRLGVGVAPPGVYLPDWVLAPPTDEEKKAIVGRFPDLVSCVEVWATKGIEAAMNECNA
ncbi:MAG: aminoacyl-tRNA hydrolase [Longimicrobiaceae bacterium]